MGNSRYILAKRINRGGMAEIFLGKALGEGGFAKLCAIKRILPHYATDQEFIAMFRDEANICKRLTHANVVQVYSFEELDDSYALIMEYVDGADLRSLLSACEKAKVRLSVPMAVFIAAEVARGLHYAHTKVDDITGQPLGIVHRDISPQNVLISYEGEVKITDFGIADAESKLTETKPGIVKGKYSYMSPEQVNAESLDARSDVFSLAIVLWEMLAMKRLFSGESEVETIKMVQNCKIPHQLRDLNPSVSAELESIVERAIAKERKRRYQTAGALEKDLLMHLHTRYPNFNTSELGNFLKQLFAERRAEIQDEIKKVLTETNVKPNNNLKSDGSKFKGGKTDSKTDSKAHAPSHVARGMVEFGTVEPSQNQLLLQKNPRPTNATSSFKGTATRNTVSHNSINHSAFRYSPSQNSYASHQKASKTPFYAWASVAMAALIIVGVMFSKKPFLATDGNLTLLLQTNPSSVRLSLNGKDIEGGSYRQTPLKLLIPPGHHRLKVSRSGYMPKELDISGNAGSTVREDRVSLDRATKVAMVPTRITVEPSTARVPININDGFYVGDAPTLVSDLEFGKNHTLIFYPLGQKGPAFKCQFIPKVRDTFRIKIDVSNKQSPTCTLQHIR